MTNKDGKIISPSMYRSVNHRPKESYDDMCRQLYEILVIIGGEEQFKKDNEEAREFFKKAIYKIDEIEQKK